MSGIQNPGPNSPFVEIMNVGSSLPHLRGITDLTFEYNPATKGIYSFAVSLDQHKLFRLVILIFRFQRQEWTSEKGSS